MNISGNSRGYWRCALIALAICFIVFASMSALSGIAPGAYYYPSYLLQAQAWLRGRIALEQSYDYLELAIYNGGYYVSFPPVPAIPMLLWTLIWGDNVPGGLFQKIYVAIACLAALSALLRRPRVRAGDCVAWAIFICLSSALLPISLVGAVWFEAQILAFLFSISAIAAIRRNRPTFSCLFYALSVGCRPFSVCLGPVLLMLYLRVNRKRGAGEKLARLAPGLILGLGIAACYAVYNYARFGDIFEFGHNYLPEFQIAEHGQFSLHYVANNWRTLFFGSPLTIEDGRVAFCEFGFSMFLSCPILICNLLWIIDDIVKRRFTPEKLVIAAMGALNVLLLLMHRTLGAHQFGLRYAIELIPLCFAYLLVSPDRRRLTIVEGAIMGSGLVFNFIGGCLVHL